MTAATTAALTCPKCESPMPTYERSGISVDQCSGCRGVFLDRGELERLIDTENAQSGGAMRGGRERGDELGGGARDEPQGRGEGGRRGGFLGDLFDFGD